MTEFVYIVATQADSTKVVDWAKTQEGALVIKEFGELGTHEHYNVLVKSQSRVDSVKRSFMNAVYTAEQLSNRSKHLCKAQQAYDLEKLIGGYLQKEIDHEVLLNSGYDLIELKKKASSIYTPNRVNLRKMRMISKDNFINIFTDFMEQKELPLRHYSDFIAICALLTTQGWLLPDNVLRNPRWIYSQIRSYMGDPTDLLLLLEDAKYETPLEKQTDEDSQTALQVHIDCNKNLFNRLKEKI